MASSGRLRLRALDEEDLEVIATVLQDALVPLKEVAYLKGEKRFVLVANRFRWEAAGRAAKAQDAASTPEEAVAEAPRDADFEDPGPPAAFERVNCGICFDKVVNVRTRGLDLKQRGRFLNLLTVKPEAEAITLLFSDGAAIRLEIAGISCRLEDLGEPWPTQWRPQHRLDADERSG